MLGFFRGAAKAFLILFFWIFIIAFFVIGIFVSVTVNSFVGIGIMLGGGIVTILMFSLCGTFLAMAEDISIIRKKLVSNEELVRQKIAEQEFDEQETDDTTDDGMWHCNVCNCYNEKSSLFCVYCGAPMRNAKQEQGKILGEGNDISQKTKSETIQVNIKQLDSNNNITNENQAENAFWDCGKCLCSNPADSLFCEHCGAPKP